MAVDKGISAGATASSTPHWSRGGTYDGDEEADGDDTFLSMEEEARS